jgi:hypothetical protein
MSAHPSCEPKSGPNCWQCRHFAITHIPAMPYACRLMGFQSKLLPCIEVLRTDGCPCRGFLPKGPVVSNLRQLF